MAHHGAVKEGRIDSRQIGYLQGGCALIGQAGREQPARQNAIPAQLAGDIQIQGGDTRSLDRGDIGGTENQGASGASRFSCSQTGAAGNKGLSVGKNIPHLQILEFKVVGYLDIDGVLQRIARPNTWRTDIREQCHALLRCNAFGVKAGLRPGRVLGKRYGRR